MNTFAKLFEAHKLRNAIVIPARISNAGGARRRAVRAAALAALAEMREDEEKESAEVLPPVPPLPKAHTRARTIRLRKKLG